MSTLSQHRNPGSQSHAIAPRPFFAWPDTLQLEADIRAFIETHNENPRPFKWTKSADEILAAVKRFWFRVEQNLCHEL